MQMAKKQRTLERLAEHRRQREEEDRRQRVMAITEFDAGNPEATMHAMAGAILEYRRVLQTLGRAVDLAKAGALFGLFGPGPLWRPRRTPETLDDVPPAA
jgi:phage terminase small subunit